ncbi:MAG: alpha/beta fold hydrolase [Desulfobacterales bacterium]|nr:alpha/beta fold hydrolase [Desulfobacterales bacterium]
MKHFLFATTKRIIKALIYLTVGGLTVLLAVFVFYLENRQDLKIWHDAELDAEFTAESPVADFAEYIKLEEKLFQQLEERVYAQVKPEDRNLLNRFNHGSMSDPSLWQQNWNRTFELAHESPKAGVLLLHGMSDSPYSLRNIGFSLHDAGATVIGLRVPGHGTAPSGLVEMHWQDMTAAVKLAMKHLHEQAKDQPLYIIGYSNGSALALYYGLTALDDAQLPKADALVLISPAIGVTKMAPLAVWQARLGHLFGLDKLAWNSIGLEYDPFKYNSFAVNAGDQIYRLTNQIQNLLKKHGETNSLDHLPPILAFQSVVDATVPTSATIKGLFDKLPAGGHELVLFDINRINEAGKFFKSDPKPDLNRMLNNTQLSYTLALMTNENSANRQVHVLRKEAGNKNINVLKLDTAWPKAMHSMSHIALPFPKTDPLYGEFSPEENPGLHLGNISVRGERGVLQVPASAMLRLRWNPFYSYLEQRIFDFVRLGNQ